MALHLNLLHEQIEAQRQRQRDPLKLGMMALGRNDRTAARRFFSQVVVDRYKSTDEYTLAQQRLRELP